MSFAEIVQEIQEGKNLDLHMNSDDKFVRREVAAYGHKLDVLINDPAEEVRVAVAHKHYGLDRLVNDRSDYVRAVAKEELEIIRSYNAGYKIIHKVDVGEDHFVVGHNPKAPAPYVTWEFVEPKHYYCQGHYFVEEKDAIVDMFKRAGETLELGDSSLAREMLTKDDRTALWLEFHNEAALQDIRNALSEEIEFLDEGYDFDALMADPDFVKQAMRLYDNLDHGYENEALRESLANLLDDFPQHKAGFVVPGLDLLEDEIRAEIKISPEEADFWKTLMHLSSAQIPEVFNCPWGDNVEFMAKAEHGLTVTLEIGPVVDPKDSNKLSETDPPEVTVKIFTEDHETVCEVKYSARELERKLTGDYQIMIGSNNATCFTLSMEEDESLRRVGNQFVFRFDGQDQRYAKHNGETCTVQRMLTSEENDILINGLMWVAKFSDGDLLHVFDYELEQLPTPERKTPLNEQVKAAEDRQAPNPVHRSDLPDKQR